MATLSNHIFYEDGVSGASSIVGFVDKKNRVVRYDLNLESGEPAKSHIYVFFDESSQSSICIGDEKQEHIAQYAKLNQKMSFYFAISTTPDAFVNAGYADISNAAGKAVFTPYRDDAHFKVTCEADILLYPDTQYYLWIFPGFSEEGNETWGWVSWGNYLAITAEASGTVEYTVTYDAGDGSGAPEEQIKIYGEDLVLSGTVPTRKGHSFLGWATAADGEVAYQPGDTYATDAAVTLYAVWKVNQYTDTFDPNGGTGGGSFTGDYGESYQAPGAAREMFAFSSWWSAPTGGTKFADQGQTLTHDDVNDTFYAQWTRTGYNIACDPQGGVFRGSSGITNVTAADGASIGAAEKAATIEQRTVTLDANGGSCLIDSLASVSRRTYTFTGWYDPEGVQVYDRDGNCIEGAYWKDGLWVHNDDLQIVALYSEEAEPFAAVELPVPTRAGYRFRGWATDPSAVEGTVGAYVPQGDVTLYAVWVEAKEVPVQRCRVLVNTRGRNRVFRVLVKIGKAVIPCILYLETRSTPLTATNDGAGTVTLHGNVSAIYEENGTVRLVGVSVEKYEDGTVTIKGGIR